MALKLKKDSNLIIITACGVIRNIFTVRKQIELIEYIGYLERSRGSLLVAILILSFTISSGNITTSQVRIPVAMVGKLIGERGKSIAEITRDSKVKINIPKVDSNEKQVVISITGQKENIKTAQYLMQKLLKGQK